LGAVSAVKGTFQLPGADPILVLVGSSDPQVVQHLDESLIAEADTVDIRSGVVWMEVSNGRTFLNRLVECLSNGSAPRPGVQVKVAVADIDSSPQELVQQALMAADLEQVATLLEQEALTNAELAYELRYQPIVRLGNRSVVGFEALIRARLQNQVLGADELLDRASRGGWLGELDQLSRQLAIRGVGPWLGAGLLFLNILAPDGTFDLAAARRSIRQAEDIGLDADQLVFEATERNRYANIDLAAAQLTKLRNAGVRIAIDDVGDGYSSLRVATSFKPDVLKLAGDLIAALPSAEATAIIRAVVDLAHRTGAWVVAEGVETEAQAKVLRGLEVDWGQGVLFGPPEVRPSG
jgi:EAL domain-containing protein (putative c-di-GMP-specific phosphodiesterase class I)